MTPPGGALLGIDVGFSAKGKTTGIAWRFRGAIEAHRAGTSWEDRREVLPRSVSFSLVALDAPICPEANGDPARSCKAVFYGRPFWNRCRPGLSHHGRGLALRRAGKEAASQFVGVLDNAFLSFGPEVYPGRPVIEAFPNTFLGVLLAPNVHERWDKNLGKLRSDWLYEAAIQEGVLHHLLCDLGWNEPHIVKQFERERDHDRRAALVCLLTAGFAQAGTAAVVGDRLGGWFWLPPLCLWQRWAQDGLLGAIKRAKSGRFPAVEVWKTPTDLSILRSLWDQK
jgi:hypothetical protein